MEAEDISEILVFNSTLTRLIAREDIGTDCKISYVQQDSRMKKTTKDNIKMGIWKFEC
jgi:hypothetical protein